MIHLHMMSIINQAFFQGISLKESHVSKPKWPSPIPVVALVSQGVRGLEDDYALQGKLRGR